MNKHLVIDSVTGVDLSLPLAGPGARCFAFIIDWLIRTTLFTAWYGVAALLYNRRWSLVAPLSPDAKWFAFVVAPAAAIYFLYHIVLEVALRGRTPGKRMAAIHVVARDGRPPNVSALLIRNVFRLVDSLPIAYGVGLVATLVTRDHVRIGDMAAGTLLAYDRTPIALPAHPELVEDLLSRWPTLDPAVRHRLAVEVLSRHGVSVANQPLSDAALKTHLQELSHGPHV
jgi:uncharacterized RDD family membrane protein YckC